MKYIRTFESTKMPSLQKYLVYQMGITEESRSFVILEVVHQFHNEEHLFPDRYIVKRLYTVSSEDSFYKTESEYHMSFNYDETKNRIKYQSDNLQDVLDKIPVIFDINKYNL